METTALGFLYGPTLVLLAVGALVIATRFMSASAPAGSGVAVDDLPDEPGGPDRTRGPYEPDRYGSSWYGPDEPAWPGSPARQSRPTPNRRADWMTGMTGMTGAADVTGGTDITDISPATGATDVLGATERTGAAEDFGLLVPVATAPEARAAQLRALLGDQGVRATLGQAGPPAPPPEAPGAGSGDGRAPRVPAPQRRHVLVFADDLARARRILRLT
ncbi:hypothetical protein MXD63_06100 [Frankia sp. Cpl3]|uniref:hypothetical protein n=1 Tax=Parafrankia colletiae TaxID=573497 RepID=UPI000B174627|nr:hypothetical protein [Parafrankia colletiae]MCK9899644.1 hypothetical protein [Frankia sp. Cpl3]